MRDYTDVWYSLGMTTNRTRALDYFVDFGTDRARRDIFNVPTDVRDEVSVLLLLDEETLRDMIIARTSVRWTR